MKSSKKVKLLVHIAKDWEEKKHPRYPAGSPMGGQFILGEQNNKVKNVASKKKKDFKLTAAEVEEQYQNAKDVLNDEMLFVNKKLNNLDWKERNNAPPPPPPSTKEISAISTYTGIAYHSVNDHLRGNAFEEQGIEEKHIMPLIKLVASGLSQMPSYNKTVYRGTDLDDDILDKYKIGEEITEAAFISTTKEQIKAFEGNTYYIIHPKQKGNCIDIQSISGIQAEAEALYLPGTKFKVLEKVGGKEMFYGENIYNNLIILEEQ